MSDATSLGITPASNVSTQLGLVQNSVFPSISTASFIGGLSQDNTDINVLSQLSPQVSKNFYTFNFEKGTNIKLAFNATVGPFGDANHDAPGSSVDAVTSAGLRYQLYDITGNVIADSAGTTAQKAAFAQLTSSTGLAAANGGYYVQVSAAPNTTLDTSQNYNFQLYSGTTYNTSFVSSAQTQGFDPNLFISAAASVSASSNLNLYTNTASLTGTVASALNIGQLTANSSELDVKSQVDTQNQAAYFNFNFDQGNALKFTLTNTTNALEQTPLRVQIYDSTGQNVIADSQGTTAQQNAFTQISSGAGLPAANGNYVVKVSYAPNADITKPQSYNFQLNSGTGYDTVYQTTAPDPVTTSSATPNLGIFTNSQAQLFSRQQFHTIGESAATSVQIGWLAANQSRLDVESQLTNADKQDVYNFTLQQGDDLKLAFSSTGDTSASHIQLLDLTGTQVLADNLGTPAQRAAFTALTSPSGLKSGPGQYTVKVGYAPGADTTKTQTYNFQIYSGTTFINSYQSTVSAQTFQNAILSGNTSVTGFSPAGAAAAYLNLLLNAPDNGPGVDNGTSILDTLATIV